MLSDVVTVQLISSAVTLISLWIHRIHGSRENKAIAVMVNGQRTAMLQKIESLEKQLAQINGQNVKLAPQMDAKSTNETGTP